MADSKAAMGGAGGGAAEDREYDSDVSEGTSALALRRREASDAEEEEDGGAAGGGHGEEEELDEEYEDVNEEYEEELEEEELEGRYTDDDKVQAADEQQNKVGGPGAAAESGEMAAASQDGKKEPEPFVVPTSGSFYMHDDRFRDNGGARPRRGMGGRKLWEAKDDKPWLHDKFEELNMQDEEDGSRRRRGASRGRGRGRGIARGRGRGRYDSREEATARPQQRFRGTRKDGQKNEDTVPAVSNKDTSDEQKLHGPSNLSCLSPPFYPTGTFPTLGSTSRDTSAETAKRGSMQRKLTASSTSFVPKISHGEGRAQPAETSNSLFSVPSPSAKQSKVPDSPARAKQQVPGPSQINSRGKQQQSPAGRATYTNDAMNASQPNRGRNMGGGKIARGTTLPYGAGVSMATRDSSFSPPSAAVQYGNQGMVAPGMDMPMSMPMSAQPPHYGFGNSEIAWVPVLTGGGGSGGYMSYMPMDGAPTGMFYPPSAQPMFHPSTRGFNAAQPLWRPPAESQGELDAIAGSHRRVNADLGSEDRQSKPRSSHMFRYSEMNFGQ